jgi:glutamate-ammonia-ligase adenylyltransferase
MPGHRSGPILSDIADAVINALMPPVIEDFARRHGTVPGANLAIVALGKLGSREMMFGSDLDLIFVYDNPQNELGSDGPKSLPASQYFARFGQQVISAITSLTAEGRLYDVDMRLRPSGASGPLAVSIAGFEKYQRTEAWTWEQMALTRARVIYASDSLRYQLEPLIDGILRVPREARTVLGDVANMRIRIADEFPGTGIWSLKFVRGGLLDLEFIAQALQLTTADKTPSVLHRPTASVFETLGDEQIGGQVAQLLAETTRLFQDIEGLFRLCLEGAPTDETIPPGLVRALCRVANMPDLPTLKAELVARQRVVIHSYEQLVGRTDARAAT